MGLSHARTVDHAIWLLQSWCSLHLFARISKLIWLVCNSFAMLIHAARPSFTMDLRHISSFDLSACCVPVFLAQRLGDTCLTGQHMEAFEAPSSPLSMLTYVLTNSHCHEQSRVTCCPWSGSHCRTSLRPYFSDAFSYNQHRSPAA